MTALLLFLALVAAGLYSITIYPCLVLLIARLRPRHWLEGECSEPVAHIVTVYNEAQNILEKIDDALEAAKGVPGMETIFASDGSTDGTNEILLREKERGFRFLALPRRGKEGAQLEAVRATDASILVFSDAASRFDATALRALVRPFRDPEVMAVSGFDVPGEAATGEDSYVRFEMRLRRAESLVESLVGLSGCLFAVRREIAEGFRAGIPSDMSSALLSITRRQRAVLASDAICSYRTTSSARTEFSRKRRTAARGLRTLFHHGPALLRARPVAVWEVISHKLLRFAAPWFLIAAAAVAFWAAASGALWGRISTGMIASAGIIGVAGQAWGGLARIRAVRAVGFFLLSSAAVLLAWFDALLARDLAGWAPTRRGDTGGPAEGA